MRIINTRSGISRVHLVVAAVLVVAILYLVSARIFHLQPFLTNTTDKPASNAQTTSKVPSAQSNFTGGNPRTPGASNDAGDSGNTVTDNNGNVSTTPPSSQWSKSKDGTSIVVYTPTANGTLASGDTLSGTSTGTSVSFRLVDNVSGVISQGKLAVVSGKFSGTFNFSTSATEGQVDVFNQASDQTESNNVTIPVSFKR